MLRVIRSFSSRISYFLLFLWSIFPSSALSFPLSALSPHSLCTEFTDAFHKSVLFPSLKPPHFDFSTSSHTDHTTSWKMLFHIPDTLRFHQQPREWNLNQTNGLSGSIIAPKRACGFHASIFCGSQSLLVGSSISLNQPSHFTFHSQPIIKKGQ